MKMDDDLEHEKLRKALRGLSRTEVFVPRTVDETIIKAARKRLSPPPGKARLPRRKGRLSHRWLPLAASIIISALILYTSWLRSSRNSFESLADMNRDGQVDIRDALLVARKIDAEEPAPDLNQDGFLDLRDAEEIAFRAVSLPDPYTL